MAVVGGTQRTTPPSLPSFSSLRRTVSLRPNFGRKGLRSVRRRGKPLLLLWPGMVDDAKVEALCEELRSIDVGDAVKVIGTWLEEHSLKQVLDSFHEAVLTDPTILGAQATVVSVPPQPAVQEKPPNAAPLTAPPADALPMPAASTSSRPGKLYDAEPISSSQVSGELLTKPDPVFHGERDERQREAAPVYEFPMHVRLLPRTHFGAVRLTCAVCGLRTGALRSAHVRP